MRKYEFTGETQNIECTGKVITLRRIRAARDFMGVKKEELGGWIETEDNLSHSGNAWVSGDAQVSGNARVFGDARVSGNAQVFGDTRVYGKVWVLGNAWVSGNAQVSGNAWVPGNARVYDIRHVFTAGPIGSRDGFVTFFRDKDCEISVKCGCFSGKLGEFLERVRKTHGDSKYAHEYILIAESAKACIDLTAEKPEEEGGSE